MTCALPNPVGFPAWLQTLLWARWPTGALDYFSRKLPEPFSIRLLGGRRYVLVSEPEAVEHVFTRFPEAGNEELRPFLGDHSLFLLQGESHATHRRLMQAAFGAEAARETADRIREETHRAIRAFSTGDEVCVTALLQKITIRVITHVILGLGDDARGAELRELLFEMTNLISGPAVFFELLQKDLGPLTPGRRIRRLLHDIDARIRAEIRAGRPHPRSALGRLIEARLPEQEIVDEAKTLLAAGQDPTAAAVAWAVYWVHTYPAVLERLRGELGTTSPDESFLDLVCKETLRIVPIVPAADRRVSERSEIMGHAIEPGTRLVACSYLTHRRPELYERPDEFVPERFERRRYTPFEYYPFGGGHRRCLGARFATVQIKVMLASLLGAVELAAPRRRPRVDQRGATLAPSRDLRLRIEKVLA
jgi:cytochrome P450